MPFLETHPSVVCTVLDDGGVLLHLETKFYYSLNRTGLAIWLCLEDRAGEPKAACAARFPENDRLARDVDDFLADLQREELVGAGEGADPAAAPGAPASAPAPGAPASTPAAAASGALPSGASAAFGALPSAVAALAAWEKPLLTRHAVPLSQILSNPFNPCVPLAE